jgi:hypothetical protein
MYLQDELKAGEPLRVRSNYPRHVRPAISFAPLLRCRFNNLGDLMNRLHWLVVVVVALASASAGQEKIFEWVKASNEAAQLDPMDYHAGRVYHPADSGGNMHVDIHARMPVTVAMASNDQWMAVTQHPEQPAHLELICAREHVVNTTFECHLLDGRPMVLLVRDERVPDRISVQSVVAVFSHGAKRFVSPNDLNITYYRWDCVQNCIQPEFGWSVLVKEKYQLSTAPKVYSILTPDRDGQPVWIRIKAPVPMTVALVPSAMADKIYDDPSALSAALESTSCKQRGVQSLNFSCNVNLADGRESLVVLPEDRGKVPHKKAEIEMQANECTANCDMLRQQK